MKILEEYIKTILSEMAYYLGDSYPHELKGKINPKSKVKIYHGTSTFHLLKIFKSGGLNIEQAFADRVWAPEKGNRGSSKGIFVSFNSPLENPHKYDPIGYSLRAARDTKSTPVVLEMEIEFEKLNIDPDDKQSEKGSENYNWGDTQGVINENIPLNKIVGIIRIFEDGSIDMNAHKKYNALSLNGYIKYLSGAKIQKDEYEEQMLDLKLRGGRKDNKEGDREIKLAKIIKYFVEGELGIMPSDQRREFNVYIEIAQELVRSGKFFNMRLMDLFGVLAEKAPHLGLDGTEYPNGSGNENMSLVRFMRGSQQF